MKKYLVIVLVLFMAISDSQGQEFKGKQILIYTRNGEGYVHDNIQASVDAVQEICKEMKIKTSVTDDPTIFESKKLQKFDAIVFSNANNEAFLNETQRLNFQEFIRSGKGWAGIHSSCASERDWPWFWSMSGGTFVHHSRLQEFDIVVTDDKHISTKHLPDPWKWEDECYYVHHMNPNIHVLISADLTTIDDSRRSEYPGTIFGDLFPLAWCHEFEGGKVWFTTLGHKIEYYQDENFRKHIAGGIQWILK